MDVDEFNELAEETKEAIAYRQECEERYKRAKEWFEAAHKTATLKKQELIGYVEKASGIERLWL